MRRLNIHIQAKSMAARVLDASANRLFRVTLLTLSSLSPFICFWPGVGTEGLVAGKGVACVLRLDEIRVLTVDSFGVMAMGSESGFNGVDAGVVTSAGWGFEGVATWAGLDFEGVATSDGLGFEGVATSAGLGSEGLLASKGFLQGAEAGGGMDASLVFLFVGVAGKFRAATFSFLARAASRAFCTLQSSMHNMYTCTYTRTLGMICLAKALRPYQPRHHAGKLHGSCWGAGTAQVCSKNCRAR